LEHLQEEKKTTLFNFENVTVKAYFLNLALMDEFDEVFDKIFFQGWKKRRSFDKFPSQLFCVQLFFVCVSHFHTQANI